MAEETQLWRLEKDCFRKLENHADLMKYGQGRPFKDKKYTSWGYSEKTLINEDIKKSLSHYLGKNALKKAKAINSENKTIIKNWVETLENAINKKAPNLTPSLDHKNKMQPDCVSMHLAQCEGFDIRHLHAMPTINMNLNNKTSSISLNWRNKHNLEVRRGKPESGAMKQSWYYKNGKFFVNAGPLPESVVYGLENKTLDKITGQKDHAPLLVINAKQDEGKKGPLILSLKLLD